MNKIVIETRDISDAFRSDLSNLDSFISSCNSNIETFNSDINYAIGSLQVRGECVDDLLTNILKGRKITCDIKKIVLTSRKVSGCKVTIILQSF